MDTSASSPRERLAAFPPAPRPPRGLQQSRLDYPVLAASAVGDWAHAQLARVTECRRGFLQHAGTLYQPLLYSFAAPGKQLRPLLLLGFSELSPRLHPPDDTVIAAAAAIEALHECSLLHDDVIDHSTVRRGRRSVAAAFTVRAAAHAGAFLAAQAITTLARACERAGFEADLQLLRELARAQIVETLPPAGSTAECLARARAIVHGKTGVLLRLAIEVGARFEAAFGGLVIGERELGNFWEALALAYQIRDDILDLEHGERLHRPGGNDLREGRPSWPIILWITSRQDIEGAWCRLREGADDASAIEHLRREILGSEAVEQAWKMVDEEAVRARALLLPLPESRGRELLLKLLACLQAR